MNPVCCGCHRRMKIAQKGAFLVDEDHVVHTCDVYRCPICGTEMATNFALAPVTYRGEPVAANLVAERGE